MNTRLSTIGAVAALAIGLLAAPASAAGTTHWVAKDGTAGPNGCGGSGAASTRISDALDVVGAGDTVIVCPGTYRETVTISVPGVKLRSAQAWKAKIAPRSPGGGAIVRVAAKNVTVQWLKIVAPTTGSCTQAGQGISIEGVRNARILSNRILANPNGATYLTSCGLNEGISVGDGSEAAYVAHNIVRAFQLVGVIVHDADAQVINNSLQYWHETSVCAAGGPACAAGRSAGPAIPAIPTGVRVYQSTAVVDLNGISSAPEGTNPDVRLQHGISTYGVDGVKIRRNDIRLVDYGMWIESSDNLRVIGNVVVGPTPPQPARARSRTAPASYAMSGILAFSGDGSRFANNRVLHNQSGLDLSSQTTGATVTGNNLTGNAYDCLDNGVSNTWTDNLGNNDHPVGLCTNAPVQDVPGSPT